MICAHVDQHVEAEELLRQRRNLAGIDGQYYAGSAGWWGLGGSNLAMRSRGAGVVSQEGHREDKDVHQPD